MSRQIDIVVQGVLGTTPTLVRTANERVYCHFRLATTPTFRVGEDWRQGETLWFTAKAWGTLARNLSMSLRKGDPVVLVGRFTQESWKRDNGTIGCTNVLTVSTGGHDLARGESHFMKVAPLTRSADSADEASASGEAGQTGEGEAAPSAGETGCAADEAGGCEAPSQPQVTGASPADPWEVTRGEAPEPGTEAFEAGDALSEEGPVSEREPGQDAEPAAPVTGGQPEVMTQPAYVLV